MDAIQEKAREVGRLVAQTDELKALKQANQRLNDDREVVTKLNRLEDLQASLARALQSGSEPSQEEQKEYQEIVEDLQGRSVYQGVIAAQANFEKLMGRVNQEIASGIEAGEKSRIILAQ
ncbi:MAG: YlbF family regulator [Longimicrobiaceae bacterium]